MVDATSGLQNLRLHRRGSINKLSSDRTEQESIKRAFWVVYSMEKPYCLQEGLRLVSKTSQNHVLVKIMPNLNDLLMKTAADSKPFS
jgi:hypothetical protein